MNFRAQAGLEYLVTYGWALLLVTTLVGIMAFVFLPPSSDQIFSSSDPTKLLLLGGEVDGLESEIKLRNVTGGPITIKSIEGSGAFTACLNSSLGFVTAGNVFTLNCMLRANAVGAATLSITYYLCSDGYSNDGDSLIDCEDPDCDTLVGCDPNHPQNPCPLPTLKYCEYGIELTCDDGFDNDRDDGLPDGGVDCDDPDCATHSSCIETCDNGIDDDGDLDVDCADSDCPDWTFCDVGQTSVCQSASCVARSLCNGQALAADEICCNNTVTATSGDLTTACCSPADCGGNLCDQGTAQCTDTTPCGDCYGYLDTIKISGTYRNNEAWVWDALYPYNFVESKSGNKSISMSTINGEYYCYMTGEMAGKHLYSSRSSYFAYNTTFCGAGGAAPSNTFCTGRPQKGAGRIGGYIEYYNAADFKMGFSTRIADSYVNTYMMCEDSRYNCALDEHCGETENVCTDYACVNQVCAERDNGSCALVTDLTDCAILGTGDTTYTLMNDLDGAQMTPLSGAACFVLTGAPNVIFDCAGHSITNPPEGITQGIFSDQNHVTIKNCTISGFGTGIYLMETSTNAHIHDNTLSNNGTAVFINRGSNTNVLIEDNEIHNNSGTGIRQWLNTGYWSTSGGYAHNIFQNNNITGNGTGISLNSSDNTITGNTITNSNWAGIYTVGANNIINNNTITGGDYSIYISAGAAGGSPYGDILINNQVSDNSTCGANTRDILCKVSTQVSAFSNNTCDTETCFGSCVNPCP